MTRAETPVELAVELAGKVFVGHLFASSAETAGDVVFGFLALGLKNICSVAPNSTRSPRYMYAV
jgi:hypothetical protein